mmetsp:Transcript_5155/g.16285  ORF Transcript_5155/g.16285 Transcript_5155/m.16285 type:complete len:286 (-) Transcript_5155:1458-2315(-)
MAAPTANFSDEASVVQTARVGRCCDAEAGRRSGGLCFAAELGRLLARGCMASSRSRWWRRASNCWTLAMRKSTCVPPGGAGSAGCAPSTLGDQARAAEPRRKGPRSMSFVASSEANLLASASARRAAWAREILDFPFLRFGWPSVDNLASSPSSSSARRSNSIRRDSSMVLPRCKTIRRDSKASYRTSISRLAKSRSTASAADLREDSKASATSPSKQRLRCSKMRCFASISCKLFSNPWRREDSCARRSPASRFCVNSKATAASRDAKARMSVTSKGAGAGASS